MLDIHKGRLKTRGSGNAQAKLTEQNVINIRYFYTRGRQQKELARTFKVSCKQIWRIIHRENWAWL